MMLNMILCLLTQKTIYDVYKLADFITGDEFWNSQIEQIYVNNQFEFELIPRVGSHIIELGRAEDLDREIRKSEIDCISRDLITSDGISMKKSV